MKLVFTIKESGNISFSDIYLIYIYIYLPLCFLQLETKYAEKVMEFYSFMDCITKVTVPTA
jgi:hypothetical protein